MLIDGKFYSDPETISYIKKLKNAVAMNEESQKIADGVIEELKQENAELNKALDKAIKLIVKAVEYNEGVCILGDGDCPVANGLCTSLSDKYKCEQEECWREYFTKDNGGDSNG